MLELKIIDFIFIYFFSYFELRVSGPHDVTNCYTMWNYVTYLSHITVMIISYKRT